MNTLSDREAIQIEISNLIDEINRISESTRFNEQKVLNGEFAGSRFHTGYKASETILQVHYGRLSRRSRRQARYSGNDVAAEGLERGDVVMNGITIRGTVAGDDTLSTSQASGSAWRRQPPSMMRQSLRVYEPLRTRRC